MKRLIAFFITVVLIGTMLTGCNLEEDDSPARRSEKKDEKIEKVEKEKLFELDVERYKAYLDVLEDVVEDNEWPDGTEVLVDGNDFGYMWDNQFAIVDVDLDGEEELLVEITTASMAGMVFKIFDYDKKVDEAVEIFACFPAVTFYDNGVLYLEASHNQTGCDEVWPFGLYRMNDKTEEYEYIGGAEGATSNSYNGYDVTKDTDGDGVIYYVYDEDATGGTPCTKEEYDGWYEEQFSNARAIYIPWENASEWNLEKIETVVETKDAVKPIRLHASVPIWQYDLDGDGETDKIEITYKQEEYDFLATEWCVYINDEKAWESEPGFLGELEVQLYRISDERSYISIKEDIVYNGDITGFALYCVKDNTLVKNVDFYSYILDNINDFHSGVEIKYMTKKELKLLGTNQFNATARINWEMNYKYDKKDACWNLKDDVFTLVYGEYLEDKEDGMTANQRFTVYKNYDSDEVAYDVEIGDILSLDAICFYEGKTYFRAQNDDGITGWFVDPEESYIMSGDTFLEGYFEEAMFAG